MLAKINDILPESNNIIITQALYASSINVQRAIENTYMEFRKEEIAKGIPSAQVKFNPKMDSFINDFLPSISFLSNKKPDVLLVLIKPSSNSFNFSLFLKTI